MPAIPIPPGPTNKEIIDLAYVGLGLTDAFFGRTDDEYATAMTLLRAMMAEYPFDQIGYDTTDDNLAERSGIEPRWLTAVAYSLTERIVAATPTRQMPPTTFRQKSEAYSKLVASLPVPKKRYAQGTPAGAGNRSNWRGYDRTFITDAS